MDSLKKGEKNHHKMLLYKLFDAFNSAIFKLFSIYQYLSMCWTIYIILTGVYTRFLTRIGRILNERFEEMLGYS